MPENTKIRVLIAEDDDNARSLLLDLLNTLGHTVVAEVSTGREAFERAKDVVPDVVLLDVHMPDGSGIEAAELITQTIPGVAVVLFSGDQTITLSDREVMATAAIAFLPKPAPPRVLDSTIRLAATRARELMSARKDAESARQALENRKTIERANWLLWVAHNLERVADRVTNICERTIFIATGEMQEIKSTDDEFWHQQQSK